MIADPTGWKNRLTEKRGKWERVNWRTWYHVSLYCVHTKKRGGAWNHLLRYLIDRLHRIPTLRHWDSKYWRSRWAFHRGHYRQTIPLDSSATFEITVLIAPVRSTIGLNRDKSTVVAEVSRTPRSSVLLTDELSIKYHQLLNHTNDSLICMPMIPSKYGYRSVNSSVSYRCKTSLTRTGCARITSSRLLKKTKWSISASSAVTGSHSCPCHVTRAACIPVAVTIDWRSTISQYARCNDNDGHEAFVLRCPSTHSNRGWLL